MMRFSNSYVANVVPLAEWLNYSTIAEKVEGSSLAALLAFSAGKSDLFTQHCHQCA